MDLKGYRYPKDLILLSVHWWVQTFTPERVRKFNHRKMPVGGRWQLDETYIKICGQWRYLYRAVDMAGRTVDFLLTAHRNRAAVLRFLRKATGQNGVPSLINIDKSGANQAGIKAFNATSHQRLPPIVLRQCKNLNNIVKHDHRFIKKLTRAMLGFKTFNSARIVLAGVEVVHMIRKGQLTPRGLGVPKSAAEQFYQLAAAGVA